MTFAKGREPDEKMKDRPFFTGGKKGLQEYAYHSTRASVRGTRLVIDRRPSSAPFMSSASEAEALSSPPTLPGPLPHLSTLLKQLSFELRRVWGTKKFFRTCMELLFFTRLRTGLTGRKKTPSHREDCLKVFSASDSRFSYRSAKPRHVPTTLEDSLRAGGSILRSTPWNKLQKWWRLFTEDKPCLNDISYYFVRTVQIGDTSR